MRPALALLLTLVLVASAAAVEIIPGRTVLVAVDDGDALTSRGLDAEPVTHGSFAQRYLVVSGGDDAAVLAADLRETPGVAAAMVVGTRELFWVPNDPHLSYQWHLQTGNSAGIHVAEAWDEETGSDDVIIAVIDTGVDWSHPDLSAKVWVNTGEVASNGVDDDGNGYIDDVRGWDCGNDDDDARPEVYTEQGIDVGFHGSHCAGIAAAATNNGVGVAGAAPNCLIMPLKVNNSSSQITDAGVTMAFAYAIDNGADVLSMSFGGPGDGGAAAFYQDLVDQAVAAGLTPVAAAGNNDTSTSMYPAACTGVISVGATDESGDRASYSTYGNWVTVNAPGSQIWSTIQSNYEFDFMSGLIFQMSYGWDGTNPYMYCDGTSMACPLVAGVVGLVLSRAPSMTAAEVADLLTTTGDDVSFDQPLGVKVNAEAAIAALDITAATPLAGSMALSAVPNPFNPRTQLAFSLPIAGPVWLEILDVRGRAVRTLVSGASYDAGSHELPWDGRDDGGRSMPSGVYLARMRHAGGQSAVKLLLAQ